MDETADAGRSTSGRRALLGSGAALASSAVLLVGGGVAGADGGGGSDGDREAIRQLSVDYAIGTDSVLRGDQATALTRYQRAFSDDATIAAGFDRSAPALTAVGPQAWLDVVAGAFEPYSATQHLLGTIDVAFTPSRRGRRTASMSTYLHATHVLIATPDLLTVLGTYFDDVERSGRGWKITNRFLQFTSFQTSPRSLP